MPEGNSEPNAGPYPSGGGFTQRVVEARVEPGIGNEAKLYVSRASIPWHHRARILGLVTAVILLSGLGSGFFLAKSFGSSLRPVDPNALQLQRDRNTMLREEVAKLEAARRNICTPGALNNLDLGGGPLPGGPATPRPGHLTNQQLNEGLENNTAYIEVDKGGGLVGIGSGFFIGPDILVTNKHVIGNARADQIKVLSERLGAQPRAVQLLASSGEIREVHGNYAAGQEDFAVLRVPGANRTAPFAIRTDTIAKLADVTAAGYPGYEVMQDRRQGSPAPGLILTSGRVKIIRTFPGFNTVVVEHMADIAQGNSGGPLIDACGNVAGVNTFVSDVAESDEANAYRIRLRYALSSASLQTFLRANNIAFKTSTSTCN
jgi:S1-C subfamily serine protease